ERARHFLKLLEATSVRSVLEKFSPEQARILVAVFSGSQALGTWLVANPQEISLLDLDSLSFARGKQGLQNEVHAWVEGLLNGSDYAAALARLRRFKQREMFRVAARDLGRLTQAPEITQEISDVADVCLDGVWRLCRQQVAQRYGEPYHQDSRGSWQ